MVDINKRDEKIMVKWMVSLLVWTIICLTSIIWLKWNISIGIYLIVVGVIKYIKREDYRKWYNRVYNTNY